MSAAETPIIYPPERGPLVECASCRGKGARSAMAGHCYDIDGGLWHEPGECTAPEHRGRQTCCLPCPTCHGKGQVPRRHYAYCKRAECVGCLPTMDELDRMPNILDVFAEMLARCIPQSPDTKTHDGAMAALRMNESEYHTVAYFARRHSLVIEALRSLLAEHDPVEHGALRLSAGIEALIAEADAR